ncbi:hypothetical protein [Cupriavidus sp. SW-Y-13]|uniref:hypothetical protein n=1 Tax=Cupriavidus sp. SW-Y-13 TaxID=2653854 RepID=UPI0013665F54|nr:hypothetical protein [Cupriavidus sp. SW-Y-13]MWL87682.1 hypothetical protein [Cupriavidus sp. SW-Y-13]
MSKSVKFLFACWGCALVALAVGYAYQWKLERDVRNAVAECEAEGVAKVAKGKAEGKAGEWETLSLICDPEMLYKLSREGAIPGVQGRITDLHTEVARGEVKFFAYFTAMMLGLLGLMPLVWYFLLRRLREVSAAVRGSD